ncbi:MAG: FAD-dependent oxidoreductase [Clostridia bacterium]|nr:FAD-dependent oxidoreductase [Clostridia bacterium]
MTETSQTVARTVSLPVITEREAFDILVVGGGTAGVIAAIAAAESGKRVLIVERSYSLGGSATGAQVTPLMMLHVDGVHNSSVSIRLQKLLEERGYTSMPAWCDKGIKTEFSPVMLRPALEEMCKAAGVTLLYGAAFVDTVREDGKIQSVLVQTLDGLVEIETKFVIDATGDAQVAYMAGCPFEAGDPQNDGVNQDMSLRFAIGGVDFEELHKTVIELGCGDVMEDGNPFFSLSSVWHSPNALTPLFQKAVDDGVLRHEDGVYFQTFAAPSLGPNVMYCNCPEAVYEHDATDPWAVTRAVVACRESILRLHTFFKTYFRGFDNSFILSFAEMPGIRESRRILGEYYLTENDYNERSKFPDGIAQTAYPIDVHAAKGVVHPRPMQQGEYFEVPYRSLVPKGIDNLLVAGRCTSASFVAQSAIRVQLVCRAMGEAAGIAAAMAVEQQQPAAEVDGAAVRAEMIARGGVFLDADR